MESRRRTPLLLGAAVGLVVLVVAFRALSSGRDAGPSQASDSEQIREAAEEKEPQVPLPADRSSSPLADLEVGTVTGAVLVSDGPGRKAGVPYLGSGSLLATCDEGGENILIQIREGRFFFRSACLGTLSVTGLELRGLPARLEGRQELVPGEENVVCFSWASLSIHLSVREQGSARELPRVSVWSVANLLSMDSFGSPEIGPGEGDTAVLREAQSPVDRKSVV